MKALNVIIKAHIGFRTGRDNESCVWFGFVVAETLQQSPKRRVGFGEEENAWAKPVAGKPMVNGQGLPLALSFQCRSHSATYPFFRPFIQQAGMDPTEYQTVRTASLLNVF